MINATVTPPMQGSCLFALLEPPFVPPPTAKKKRRGKRVQLDETGTVFFNSSRIVLTH